jgi:hypothetical protein
MTNQQAGENDADAPGTSNPQTEYHDAAAAICGEKSHTVTEPLVSRSKQSGRFSSSDCGVALTASHRGGCLKSSSQFLWASLSAV